MMRNKPLYFILLSLLLLGICNPAPATAGGGQGTGSGGDSVAMEFYSIGTVIVKSLTTDPAMPALFPEVVTTALSRALEETVVRGSDEILRDRLGNEKIAINYWEDGKASPGLRLPFTLRQRRVYLTRPSEEVVMRGSCVLQYR